MSENRSLLEKTTKHKMLIFLWLDYVGTCCGHGYLGIITTKILRMKVIEKKIKGDL